MRKEKNPDGPLDENGDPIYDGPSRSQRKRDAEDLQALGKELTQKPEYVLERAGLPEEILEAVAEFRRMKSFGAQRRQLQFIGRVMRQFDGDAVREAVARADGTSASARAAQKRCERLRAQLLESDDALTAFIGRHPGCDVRRVRQLVRAARKESEAAGDGKSARELYRLLYELELPPVVDFLPPKDDEDEES